MAVACLKKLVLDSSRHLAEYLALLLDVEASGALGFVFDTLAEDGYTIVETFLVLAGLSLLSRCCTEISAKSFSF